MLLASRFLTFENFRFRVPTRELMRLGSDESAIPIPLGLRAADLLLFFLERPGQLVTKDEIMQAVWPGMAVEESNLTVQISAIRRAIDGGRTQGSCIQNVPRRGYRFTLAVVEDGEGATFQLGAKSATPIPADVTPDLSRPPTASVTNRHLRRAAAAAVLCAVLIILSWPLVQSHRSAPPVELRRLSIVALPFTSAGGNPKDDDLAAALTNAVTTSLAQTPGAFVVAHSMAEAIVSRKLPMPAIGSELGVRYVLEGTIRTDADVTQLKVQLSEASTGASVWTAQLQAGGNELREQVRKNLLFPLSTAFMDAEVNRLSKLPLEALTVEEILLKVRAGYNHQPITPARTAENIALLERGLRLAPNSPEILISLANEHLRPILEFGFRDELSLGGRDYVERARALAAGSDAMLELQALQLRVEARFDEATAAYRSLMQASPGSTRYHVELARNLITIGKSAEAVPLLEEFMRRGDGAAPRFVPSWTLGQALLRLRRNEEAITWLLAAREQSSGFIPEISLWLTAAYANSGKIKDARHELHNYIKQRPLATLASVRRAPKPTRSAAEEQQNEIDGLVIAGLRDHVDEDAETGLLVSIGIRPSPLNAPTPLGAPGVSVIRTAELAALLNQPQAIQGELPLLLSTTCTYCFDVDFPGSIHVPQYLRQEPMDDEKRRALKAWLDPLMGANPQRRIITMSWNAERWHSRNLALELVALGYPQVTWYRGGLEAWDTAGLPMEKRNYLAGR
jgi:adenylate cyclase